MSSYLQTRALAASQMLKSQTLVSQIKKNVCNFTAGTMMGTQNTEYSMVPLYSNSECTTQVGTITFIDNIVNIADNYTIYEKGILSFTKKDPAGNVIDSPTVQYEYASGTNNNSVFFANGSNHTFKIVGYGRDKDNADLLDITNVKITININGDLRTATFSNLPATGLGANSVLKSTYYYTLKDFAFPGHPGTCNDYFYSANNQ